MKPNLTIKETYHDALYFASSRTNKKEYYFLDTAEFKTLLKLIQYDRTYFEITFQNKDIAKHTYLAETTVKDTLESLKRKGYINSERDVYNNRLGYKSKRTITINWELIQKIFDITNSKEASQPIKEEVKETIQPETIKEELLAYIKANRKKAYVTGYGITEVENDVKAGNINTLNELIIRLKI